MEANIFEKYISLINDEVIRILLTTIVKYKNTEIIDCNTSLHCLNMLVDERPDLLQNPRRSIMDFLNYLWLCGPENLTQNFWWQMRDSILRITLIAIVLEVRNSKKNGAIRTGVENIPPAIIFLHCFIKTECTDERLKEVCNEYTKCYTKVNEWCKRLDSKGLRLFF